jgi:hypothetical protein
MVSDLRPREAHLAGGDVTPLTGQDYREASASDRPDREHNAFMTAKQQCR